MHRNAKGAKRESKKTGPGRICKAINASNESAGAVASIQEIRTRLLFP